MPLICRAFLEGCIRALRWPKMNWPPTSSACWPRDPQAFPCLLHRVLPVQEPVHPGGEGGSWIFRGRGPDPWVPRGGPAHRPLRCPESGPPGGLCWAVTRTSSTAVGLLTARPSGSSTTHLPPCAATYRSRGSYGFDPGERENPVRPGIPRPWPACAAAWPPARGPSRGWQQC